MGYVRKVKGSLVQQELNDYIGEESYMFYDVVTGATRMWTGQPGGKPIAGHVGEYPTFADFPTTGEADIVYIDGSASTAFRWDGSAYVQLRAPILEAHLVNYDNPHSTTLANLTDTTISSPSDNEILGYNGATGKWVPMAYELDDLTDVDTTSLDPTPSDADLWALMTYDIYTGTWSPEDRLDHRPRNQYSQLFIVPSETVHPTVTYGAGELGTLPFYPYKTGWSIDPPVWHGFHFLYDNVWSDYKVRGNMFSLNANGRVECNWYGDLHLSMYTTLAHSANGASVGIAIARYRPGVGEQYFPLVSTTELPNNGKPRSLSMNTIVYCWPEDEIGLGICTDVAGTITFYDGSLIMDGIMSYVPGL